MSLWMFASAKGSPGVTTSVLALAACWPGKALVAELDPDGGDVAAWFDLACDPGLVSCAATGRRRLEAATLLAHTRRLPGPVGAGLLTGPEAAEQAHAALGALVGAGLADVLTALTGRGSEVDVLADCGRLGPGSPAVGLAEAAKAVVLVLRPVLAQIAHVRARVAALHAQGVAWVGLLLVGAGPYAPGEVAAATGAPVTGVLADDPRGAALLTGQLGSPARLARSPLLRSAEPVAERLAGGLEVGSAEAEPGRWHRPAAASSAAWGGR